jgi:hypothetical protein
MMRKSLVEERKAMALEFLKKSSMASGVADVANYVKNL